MDHHKQAFLDAHEAWMKAGEKLNREVQALIFDTLSDEQIKALIREHNAAHRSYMAALEQYNAALRQR
ncbi:hypothetical protein [Paraburkholderia sp. J12]|uniref:hypothetical protein n=1 Tax=Paraburkholderia sp. J12 TaxID=2805432 RepID=UPI002ABE5051|nr:hypothetical protein [Paraburkholderia sp. J12]